MESEGQETVGTEGLPAAVFTDGHRGGATAVVVNESLVAVFKVGLDGGEKRVGEVAVFGEVVTLGKVDDFDGGLESRRFCLFGERDERVFLAGEVKVGSERSGGAEKAGDFKRAGHERGEAESGVFRGVFLIIGGLVGFVDDDEAEVF